MDHAQIVGWLSAYLDNAVGKEEKETIKHHLGCCGSCREVLAGMEWTVEQLKRLPDVEPPLGLTGQIMITVQQAPSSRPAPWRVLFSPLQVRLPLLLGGLIVIGIGAYKVFLTHQPPPSPASVFQPSASPGPVAPAGSASVATPSAPLRVIKSSQEERVAVPLPIAYPPPAGKPVSSPARPETRSEPVPALPANSAEPGLQPADEWTVPEPEPHNQVVRDGTRRAAGMQRQAEESDAQAPRGEGVEVVLEMKDPAGSTHSIEEAVTRFGGRIRGHSYSDTVRMLFAQVEAQKLPGLLDRLARLGTVEGRPGAAAGKTGKVDLVVRW